MKSLDSRSDLPPPPYGSNWGYKIVDSRSKNKGDIREKDEIGYFMTPV